MNISPVYELRERLRAAAIAGVGAGAEDFRLKRAIEALEPLEKVAPVFAGLIRFARLAADEGCEDRAGALLDALTLTDALLCTQSAVNVPGEIMPLATTEDASGEIELTTAEVPYSVLSRLLDALTHAGGGRYSYVVELRKERPELFRDYRIREAMVDALGASFAELAEAVTGWLIEDGKRDGGRGILPLLQRGFDPKGKKEMVRRVQVMEAVAGARANEFYRRVLPEAEKEVRQALLYALRLTPENVELLLQLVRTERGNNRKMACLSLACMESREAWDYFRALAEKKPEDVAEYLEFSKRPEASALVAEIFLQLMEKQKARGGKTEKEEEALLAACLRALPGKGGEEICACYRMAAALSRVWDGPESKSGPDAVFMAPDRSFPRGTTKGQMLPVLLQQGLILNPAPELIGLAGELYRTLGESYFPAAMTACLIAGQKEEGLELLRSFVEKKQLLGKRLRKERAPFVWQAFASMEADREKGGYVLKALSWHPAGGAPEQCIRRVGPVPEGMYELLMALENRKTDMILASWIRPEDQEMSAALADYFYKRALKTADNRCYLEPLSRCRLKDCSGLAVTYFRAKARTAGWEICSYLDQLPGDGEAKRAEAESLLSLLKKGEIRGVSGCIPVLETYIKERL